jgi:hypothetical protein
MKAEDIALIVKSTTPVYREFAEQSEKRLLAIIAGLELRLAAAEQKAAIPGRDGKDGVDGQSVDLAWAEGLIEQSVQKAVSSLPVPKDGASVTVEDLTPVVADLVAKAVLRLPVPKDGVGISSTLLDRKGHLVLTLSDGQTKDIGRVEGKDADPADVQRMVAEAIATLPKPADGAPGKDGAPGRDGTLENVKVVQVDDRTWQWQYKDGTPVEGGTMRFAVVLDRGVHAVEKTYEAGDGVTWNGSFWIAQCDATSRPGTTDGAKEWRLAVKSGRDGAKGRDGVDGKHGRDGKDLISKTGAPW